MALPARSTPPTGNDGDEPGPANEQPITPPAAEGVGPRSREGAPAAPKSGAKPKVDRSAGALPPEQDAEFVDVQPTADILQGKPAAAEPEPDEFEPERYWLDEDGDKPDWLNEDYSAAPPSAPPVDLAPKSSAPAPARTAQGAAKRPMHAKVRLSAKQPERGATISLSLIVMAIFAALVSAGVVLILF
jgi:hypothetical protein